MNSYSNKLISFLLLTVTLLSVFSACTADGTSSAVSTLSDTASSKDVSSVVVDGNTSSGNASSETAVPESDISFKPEKITLSDAEIAQYSYMPQITEIMPTVHINTADGSNSFATDYTRSDKLLDLIDYVDATVSIDNCDGEFVLNDVEAEVKVRGNYTLNYDKKPIRIKFSKKQSVLGLHSGEKYKNWVLLADWKDLSMLNNVMSFYLGNTILGSDGYYCTDFRNVELYLNGEYWGVYLLVEQQEAKDGRMSIPEVEEDYTGVDIGYLMEFDGYYVQENEMPNGSGDPTFVIDHFGKPYDQPGYTLKSDIYDPAQLQFISNHVQNVYAVLYAATENGRYMTFNEDYTDLADSDFTTAEEAICSVIDIQSLVDTYILNEIACDPDVDWSSFYISVDMTENGSKKLIFEAPWDFDSGFGIKRDYTDADVMFASESLNPWFNLLKDEAWFYELVKVKWDKLKQAGVLDNALSLILRHKVIYVDYYEQNYVKWRRRVTGGNGEVIPEINTYTTQSQAADYMYNWLVKRFTYLDSQLKIVSE